MSPLLLSFDKDPSSLLHCRSPLHPLRVPEERGRVRLIRGDYGDGVGENVRRGWGEEEEGVQGGNFGKVCEGEERNDDAERNEDAELVNQTQPSTPDLPPNLENRTRFILLDLGVSSHQIDEAGGRGFSWRYPGPLDMRMDGVRMDSTPSPPSPGVVPPPPPPTTHPVPLRPPASSLLSTITQPSLSRLLRLYSDEPRSSPLSKSIKSSPSMLTTTDLNAAIFRVVPPHTRSRRLSRQKTMTRVYQALRIAVNGEVEALERVLEEAGKLLAPGGVIAVMTYHSVEDRIVKQAFRSAGVGAGATAAGTTRSDYRDTWDEKDVYGNWKDSRKWEVLKVPNKGKPTEEEIKRNPRAKSAKLRVARRL